MTDIVRVRRRARFDVPPVRTNVKIAVDIHAKAELFAANQGWTLNMVVNRALAEYVDEASRADPLLAFQLGYVGDRAVEEGRPVVHRRQRPSGNPFT